MNRSSWLNEIDPDHVAARGMSLSDVNEFRRWYRVMTKPVPDKAEVALEFPDKLYIGTFEQTSRFDAHLDKAGISLSLYRVGAAQVRKAVRMHFHYELFAEILRDLAKTVSSRTVG